MLEGADTLSVNYRLRSPLYGTWWVRLHGRSFQNADGRLTHISGYLTDIEPSSRPASDRNRVDREQALVAHLIQGQDLAASLEYDMLCALVDATLLETGYQVAKRLGTERM